MSDTPRTDPTNARYNSLQLQCYEQRKEINRLNEHLQLKEELLSEIERENAPQLTRELTAANERIKRLVQAGDCLLSHRNSTDYHEKVREWDKAKKDKP
jgi:transposase